MDTHDSLDVKTVYEDPGILCRCKVKREAPGPDHRPDCPWYANSRLKKIHLRPEQTPLKILGGPVATFHIVPWKKE